MANLTFRTITGARLEPCRYNNHAVLAQADNAILGFITLDSTHSAREAFGFHPLSDPEAPRRAPAPALLRPHPATTSSKRCSAPIPPSPSSRPRSHSAPSIFIPIRCTPSFPAQRSAPSTSFSTTAAPSASSTIFRTPAPNTFRSIPNRAPELHPLPAIAHQSSSPLTASWLRAMITDFVPPAITRRPLTPPTQNHTFPMTGKKQTASPITAREESQHTSQHGVGLFLSLLKAGSVTPPAPNLEILSLKT